jgi:hypothetical protein
MSPLGFVNWRQMNTYFCLTMWLIAIVLAVIILGHIAHAAPATGHAATQIIR